MARLLARSASTAARVARDRRLAARVRCDRPRARGAAGARATATVAGAYALNTAIKLLVRRRRPQLPGLPPLTARRRELSFPSAHAATSFAGALRVLAPGRCPRAPLYALAAALSLSRLYLGVHYPSDVLAGALLGTAVGRWPARRRARRAAERTAR